MDTSILELFTAEEILKRLTKREATGVVHVFNARDSANVFFQKGMIVAAANGVAEGEEVVRHVVEWPDARFIWQREEKAPAALEALDLHFPEFMAKLRMAPRIESAPLPEAKEAETEPLEPKQVAPNPVFISIASRAASTGPLLPAKTATQEVLTPAAVSKSQLIPVPNALTATKNISGGGNDTFEKALMRKYQLALASVDNPSAQRLRIVRSSNLVGRNPACDFTMNHTSISRQHCLLQITERGLHVKDLSTTNGTKVNGINLTEGYVSVGDMLTFGHLSFMVEKDEAVGA